MITRRQFLRRGALWVPSLAIARATLAQEQYLQNRRKAFRSTAWTPLSVAGCVGWWKADAIVGLNDGDYVASWVDSSTAGNTATQSGADSTKPTYQTNEKNGLPVVRFDGGDWLVLTSAITGVKPWTIFSVQLRSGTPHVAIGVDTASNAPYSAVEYTDSNVWVAGRVGYCYYTLWGAAWSILTTGMDNSDKATIRRNGSALAVTQGSSTYTGDFKWIGRKNSSYANGDIGEILFYNVIVSPTDVALIESYLNTKWTVY